MLVVTIFVIFYIIDSIVLHGVGTQAFYRCYLTIAYANQPTNPSIDQPINPSIDRSRYESIKPVYTVLR